jgi:hypothetical protein
MNIKIRTKQLTVTTDDTEFTQDEVRQTIEGFNRRKVPGPDKITMTS